MSKPEDEFALIQEWKEKFKEGMDEIVKLRLEAEPGADPNEIKEDYLLRKIATNFVGCVILGRQVRELEKKLNELDKNT